jgi:hypothetical protein
MRRLIACLLVVPLLSGIGLTGSEKDLSRKSVAELIDDLTAIDSQSPGINSATFYQGFIADNSPAPFHGGVLGFAAPKVPPQLSELVRRGASALPELIKHLDDKRPTKLEVGNKPSGKRIGVDVFMFSYFSNEYDPRTRTWSDLGHGTMGKDFKGTYTVQVADVCYVLIGQIVNRRLWAVRYQPSAELVVNSPIEAPVLAEKVRSDWGATDAEALRNSLLEVMHFVALPKGVTWADYTVRFVNPVLARLGFYFPDTYRALQGNDLRYRKTFEVQEARERREGTR